MPLQSFELEQGLYISEQKRTFIGIKLYISSLCIPFLAVMLLGNTIPGLGLYTKTEGDDISSFLYEG